MSGLRSIGRLAVRTRSNAVTVREVVDQNSATPLALGMAALYQECVAQILKDESVRFHVLMMPTMTGDHYIYSMRDEEDMCQHVANLMNVNIYDNDCVVILGQDFLENEISEDEMMKVAIGDVALHLGRISPICPETGWYGQNIGWGAIGSVIVCSHPMVRALSDTNLLNERIKNGAINSIIADHRSKAAEGYREQNRCAFEAIERICDRSQEECGGYISLPATAAEIVEIATGYYHEAINSMAMAPRVIS